MGRMFILQRTMNPEHEFKKLSPDVDKVELGEHLFDIRIWKALPTKEVISILKLVPPQVSALSFDGVNLQDTPDLPEILSSIPKHVSALSFKETYLGDNPDLPQILSNIPKTVTHLNLSGNFTRLHKNNPSLKQIFTAIPRTVINLNLCNIYLNSTLKFHNRDVHLTYHEYNHLEEAFNELPEHLEELALDIMSFHNKSLDNTLKSLPKKIKALTIGHTFGYISVESPTLAEFIKATPKTITTVRFHLGCLTMEEFNGFLDAVKALPIHITYLDLSGWLPDFQFCAENNNSPIFKSYYQLIQSIPSSVTSLDLSHTFYNHTDRFLNAIPETVTSLKLSLNYLSLNSVSKMPKHIKTLDLRGNSWFSSLEFSKLCDYIPKSVTTVHTDSGTFGPAECHKGRTINTLTEQIETLIKKKYKLIDTAANTTVGTLVKVLTKLKTEYESDTVSIDNLKTNSIEAIKGARDVLEVHRGWKEILGNIALAILGLGVGYIAVCAYKGSFFKFKTDSANILDEAEEKIKGVDPL